MTCLQIVSLQRAGCWVCVGWWPGVPGDQAQGVCRGQRAHLHHPFKPNRHEAGTAGLVSVARASLPCFPLTCIYVAVLVLVMAVHVILLWCLMFSWVSVCLRVHSPCRRSIELGQGCTDGSVTSTTRTQWRRHPGHCNPRREALFGHCAPNWKRGAGACTTSMCGFASLA